MFHISYMQGFPESCKIIPSFLLYRIIEIFRVLHTFRKKEQGENGGKKEGRLTEVYSESWTFDLIVKS